MQVLFVVLNEVDYLNDILEGFVDVGVTGATVIDSQGMASVIVNNSNQSVPLFGYLKKILEDSLPYNKTIFTVLQSDDLVEKAVAVVQDIVDEINSPNVGFMFTIPIGQTYPMKKD